MVREDRENDVIMKYGFYQDEIQWLIAVNRQMSKHHRERSERNMNLQEFGTFEATKSEVDFSAVSCLQKPNSFHSLARQSPIKC